MMIKLPWQLVAATLLLTAPACVFLCIFILILQTKDQQLILIALTNTMSYLAGMGSTGSTMMTGKDLFEKPDSDSLPPPMRKTTDTREVLESLPTTGEKKDADPEEAPPKP